MAVPRQHDTYPRGGEPATALLQLPDFPELLCKLLRIGRRVIADAIHAHVGCHLPGDRVLPLHEGNLRSMSIEVGTLADDRNHAIRIVGRTEWNQHFREF